MLVLETKLPCAICKKPGERRAIEGLPHNGILWWFIHDDGSEAHEWGRYKSFEDLAKHKDTNPAEMKCPRCKQHGTISAWREDPTNKPYKYRYTIKHYYNLKSKFLSKQCHIYTQEQRDFAMKESRLLDSIGMAQMEQEIQKKVIDFTKRNQERIAEETGIQSSLTEEDMKEYLQQVIEEVKKDKRKP